MDALKHESLATFLLNHWLLILVVGWLTLWFIEKMGARWRGWGK